MLGRIIHEPGAAAAEIAVLPTVQVRLGLHFGLQIADWKFTKRLVRTIKLMGKSEILDSI
jgi:hypothetical protein